MINQLYVCFLMDSEHIIKSFGETVKKMRLEKGWTQTKLAVEIGIEPQHLSKLERGLHEPGIVTVVFLAKALTCRVDELIVI